MRAARTHSLRTTTVGLSGWRHPLRCESARKAEHDGNRHSLPVRTTGGRARPILHNQAPPMRPHGKIDTLTPQKHTTRHACRVPAAPSGSARTTPRSQMHADDRPIPTDKPTTEADRPNVEHKRAHLRRRADQAIPSAAQARSTPLARAHRREVVAATRRTAPPAFSRRTQSSVDSQCARRARHVGGDCDVCATGRFDEAAIHRFGVVDRGWWCGVSCGALSTTNSPALATTFGSSKVTSTGLDLA